MQAWGPAAWAPAAMCRDETCARPVCGPTCRTQLRNILNKQSRLSRRVEMSVDEKSRVHDLVTASPAGLPASPQPQPECKPRHGFARCDSNRGLCARSRIERVECCRQPFRLCARSRLSARVCPAFASSRGAGSALIAAARTEDLARLVLPPPRPAGGARPLGGAQRAR
eukprot:2296824-Prymnesium_polylepis.1